MKLLCTRVAEVGAVRGVEVKSVEIKRNTHSEGELLDHN